MEPSLDTIVLHPAVLIASGFEALSSKEVRFLHSYRKHFDQIKQDTFKTLLLSQKEFELGGILNPFGTFYNIPYQYKLACEKVPNFPYLTRKEIIKSFYSFHLNKIWNNLLHEVFSELTMMRLNQKRPLSYFVPTKKVLHDLYRLPVYHKIAALHLCGMGGKLGDAFAYIFDLFTIHESQQGSRSITASSS